MSITGIAKSFCVVGDGQTSPGPPPEAEASGKPASPTRLPLLLPPPLLLEVEPPEELPLPLLLPPPSPAFGVPWSNPEPFERLPQE
jgi:hypothetical protein